MRKRNKNALAIIYQTMDEGTFENISSVTTSKEVLKILLNTPNKVDNV